MEGSGRRDNIIGAIDFGRSQDPTRRPWLVMEFIPHACTLQNLIDHQNSELYAVIHLQREHGACPYGTLEKEAAGTQHFRLRAADKSRL